MKFLIQSLVWLNLNYYLFWISEFCSELTIFFLPQDIFRKYPNKYESIIATLCENLDTLDEPEARYFKILHD